jgi:hypothetical protein
MSAGQWKANAEALASMSAANKAARRIFIQFLLLKVRRGTASPSRSPAMTIRKRRERQTYSGRR